MSDDEAEKESWVRRRAYQLWQEGGEAHGRHDDHWHQAERDYEEAMNAPNRVAAPSGDLEQDLIETPPATGETPNAEARRTGSAATGASAIDRDPPGRV